VTQVLCYHDLGDRVGLGITRVRPRTFAEHVEYLRDRGWRFVPLSDKTTADGEAQGVAITFDDAYATQLREALDVLGRDRIPATAFVIADFVGRKAAWDYADRGRAHADWGLLAEWLAAGMTIGAHGRRHVDLRNLGDARLNDELRGSRDQLQAKLDTDVTTVAYPFGRCNKRVVTAARAAGYRTGFGTQPRGGIDARMHRPRLVATRLDTPVAVEQRLRSTPWGTLERGKQRLVSFWAGGTPFYQRLRGDMR